MRYISRTKKKSAFAYTWALAVLVPIFLESCENAPTEPKLTTAGQKSTCNLKYADATANPAKAGDYFLERYSCDPELN
jgi:hypothetical protein